jgi:phosphoglycerol transferase MdoB-like AlkP superfamily enzyme
MPSRRHSEAQGEIAMSSAQRSPASSPFAGAASWAAHLATQNGALLGAGVVLPNILSLATLGSVIDVGLPPRTSCILAYAALAMCARRIPFVITAILFFVILAFDLVWTLSVSFGLRPHDLVVALDYARHIHVLDSPLYVTLVAVLAVTAAATLRLLSNRDALLRGNVVALFAGALLFAGVDYISNADAHYDFGATIHPGGPVESAINNSGFSTVAGVNGRNVVLVIVESLGYLLDPAAREKVDAPLYQSSVTDKYRVTTGRIVYYGSTTSAEMRELCETSAPYAEFTESNGMSCLPERLHLRGYTTTAVHAFHGSVFNREVWYPRIGFDNEIFGPALAKQTKRVCGNAFIGPCDADLSPIIAAQTVHTRKPDFIYWLTLNTHIPVSPGEALTNFDCAHGPGVFRQAMVCSMAELRHDVFAAVATLALDPAVGPAEILLVGDHAPPLWSKRGRAQFEAGKVPWYRLTPRNDLVASFDKTGAALTAQH